MQKKGIVVLGVSADDVTSHQKFADKYGLNFQPLKCYKLWTNWVSDLFLFSIRRIWIIAHNPQYWSVPDTCQWQINFVRLLINSNRVHIKGESIVT